MVDSSCKREVYGSEMKVERMVSFLYLMAKRSIVRFLTNMNLTLKKHGQRKYVVFLLANYHQQKHLKTMLKMES